MIAHLTAFRGLEVALGLERGHASAAGRRDRLSKREVLDVARCEDARYAGRSTPRLDLDVAVRQQLDLAAEDLRVGLMTDRDEETVDGPLRLGPGLHVLQAHRRDLALLNVKDVLDHRVPDESDLRILERALLHDLGRAQRVAPVDDVHPAAEAGVAERHPPPR